MNQTVWILEGKGAKNKSIYKSEHGRVGTDPDRQAQCSYQCNARVLCQPAPSHSQVLQQFAHRVSSLTEKHFALLATKSQS